MDYLKLKRGQSSPKVYINKNKKRRTAKAEEENVKQDTQEYPNILVELEDEIQRQLEAKAEKSNLSVRNVKNILKNVLTNEDVLKLVDDSSDRSIYDLKFTRAKTKQLLGQDSHPIWRQKKSVAEILIHEEFPEDSSDEEYNPHEEAHSDEETKVDEILDIVEEVVEPPANNIESIGHRTRSKLCLSETPLEIIEQAFIPPDITPDMYNTDCDNQDWLNFLKEFTQPLEPTHNETINDDDDPEWKFLMDEEQEAVTDKEELRVDRAVKVSKKELNELMTELVEYTQMHESDEEEVDKEKSEVPETVSEPAPEVPVPEKPVVNETERRQKLLFRQQLRQHIQLLLQQFILSHNHPDLDPSYPEDFKAMIIKFDELRKNGNSICNVKTLTPSLSLIKKYEDAQLDLKRMNITRSKIPPEIMEFCIESDAFPYPLLLPQYDFSNLECKSRFSIHEDRLIAFFLYNKGLAGGIMMSNIEFMNLSQELHKIIPGKSKDLIYQHIKRTLKSRHNNPIKDIFLEGKLFEWNHFLISLPRQLKKISEHPRDLMPDNWLHFLDTYKM